jgi:uncharacterized protein involved in type VI secretion and phage assembly
VVTGIVKSLEDPEGQGRIELQFPWLSEAQRSAWAPVASPLAGKQRGLFFMPELEDEVLVAFEHGDFAHPYILGFLWNGVDKPPEGTNQNRVILTPGGHTLRFEDRAGERKIIIQSAGGSKVELNDQDHSVTVSGEGGANKVTIQTLSGTVTIQAAAQIAVQAPSIAVTAPLVTLGSAAAHPMVFGDQLLAYLGQLAAAVQAHMHPGETVGVTPVTPAAPPPGTIPMPTPALVSTQVRTG